MESARFTNISALRHRGTSRSFRIGWGRALRSGLWAAWWRIAAKTQTSGTAQGHSFALYRSLRRLFDSVVVVVVVVVVSFDAGDSFIVGKWFGHQA